MAEISQKSPLDQQALDRKKHNNELQPSLDDDDDEHGMDPPPHQDLHSVIQHPEQDQDGLRSPAQQDQAGLRCTDHNQSHLERPDDLCANHLDQHPVQGQGRLHDSHKEAVPCGRSSLDQDHVQDQDNRNSRDSIQAQNHDRLHGPPEHEVQVEVEIRDHRKLRSVDLDPHEAQQEVQGVDQRPIEAQDCYVQGLTHNSDLFQVDNHCSLPHWVQDQDHDSAQQQGLGRRADPGLDGEQDTWSTDHDPQLLEVGSNSLHNNPSYFAAKEKENDVSAKCVNQALPQDEDQASPQDEDRGSSQNVDRGSSQNVDQASPQDEDQMSPQDEDQALAQDEDEDQASPQDEDRASSKNVDQASSQDEDQASPQDKDQASPQNVDQASPQDEDQALPQDEEQALLQNIDQASPQDEDQALPQDEEQASPQDEDQASPQDEDQASPQDEGQVSPQDEGQKSPQDKDQKSPQDEDHQTSSVQQTPANPDQDLTTGAACEDEAGESGGRVPALVITQAEGSQRPVLAQPVAPPVTPAEPAEPAEPQKPERPADLVIPAAAFMPTDPSPSSSDGGDMACSDLMSLKSDSTSLVSEVADSRRSEEDTRSVAASSVMSLDHRVQMEPVEKDWLRSSAVGNIAAQRQLLALEPGLALKKDFITGFTALHWAAKQGRVEAVDMMLHSGVDVNVRSHGGYTALHLASIHGHHHVIQALINTYNAKTNVRDYHGKMAVHYWSGSTDVFTKPDAQPAVTLSRGRRTQRYALPSVLLSRSRSQGQLNLDFGTVPQSQDMLDLQM